MNENRFWARLVGSCVALAGMAGCAMLGRNESQLFSRESRYESAAITYRVGPVAAGNASQNVSLAAYQTPVPSGSGSGGRRSTLAIRYPHPSGRAGFARVELIVQTGTADASRTSTWVPGWLDQARRCSQEWMPGISMGPGVHEALGLDLPIADLDRVVAKLQQPIQPTAGVARTKPALVSAKINGAPLSLPAIRVAELDALIARVRREGSLISHSSATMDWELDAQPAPVSRQEPSAVVRASYTEPAPERLPPVDVITP